MDGIAVRAAENPAGTPANPGTVAMEASGAPSVTQDLPRPQPVSQPLTEAQMQARAADIAPGDVLPVPSNQVADVTEAAAKDAGRYVPAKAVSERSELARGTVRAWNGAEVPKVGPTDMVGWLRLNGGLADQGGELSHMGLTNAARRDMDFVARNSGSARW